MARVSERPLDAALEYAERGWAVFPCHSVHDAGCTCHNVECGSPGKHPRVGGGLTAATTDREEVRRWWRQWPSSNVAIRTGAASGLVVVDIDPDHGGAETFDELIRRHGAPTKGPVVRTGSGGSHLFFAHPGERVRNSASALGPGVDVRGDGGYVIAPPSRHLSGTTYRWEITASRLPALPAWILESNGEPRQTSHWDTEPIRIDRAVSAWARVALDDEAARVRAAVVGTRNSTLNRAAFSVGQIVGAGLLDSTTVESVLVTSAVEAGLGEFEARRTVRSGLRAGVEKPRGPQRAVARDEGSLSISGPGLDVIELP